MSVTIKDVAKEAGVSAGTVSRYLNGYALKESNNLKIKNAIDKLDYRENIIAKGLKNNKSHIIGVVISSLTDIFSTSIVTYIEQIVEEHNYSIVLCTYKGSEKKLKEKIEFLKNRSADGIIVFRGNRDISFIKEIVKDKIPVILVDDKHKEYSSVSINNSKAIYMAVRYLVNKGYKQIGIICGNKDTFIGSQRYKGYVNCLKDNNIEIKDELVKWGDFGIKSGYNAMNQFINEDKNLEAVIVSNYYMTLGAITAINQKNIKIPEDISFIGFDYFEIMEVIKPPLTIIRQPYKKIGNIAANLMLKALKGKKEVKHKEVEAEFIIKDSVK